MSQFQRYIGIDYSGAETPTSSLPGLRVYEANPDRVPAEVLPPPGPRKYWTRRGIAEWLREQLLLDEPTIVGIDHAFSFPAQYFEMHNLPLDWPSFLEDFRHHWPTHEDHTKAKKEAGIKDSRFHDLRRHTAATRMADGGADAFALAEIFGWSDVRMALRYTHATDESKRRAVENLVKPIGPSDESVTNEKGRVAALP